MRSTGPGSALGIALGLALAAACSSSDEAGPPVQVEPATLYAQSCARCHGRDGRGDPQMKATLPVRDFTEPAFRARARTEELERVIMAGRGQMPGFGSALSGPKIQALAGYVKRLAAGTAER